MLCAHRRTFGAVSFQETASDAPDLVVPNDAFAWRLPTILLASGLAVIALGPFRDTLWTFGVYRLGATDFVYLGESATIAGWLIVGAAAVAAAGRISGDSRRFIPALLRTSAIGAVLLSASATLGFVASIILRDHFPPFGHGGWQQYLSLEQTLVRTADGISTAAWLVIVVGVLVALTRSHHESGGAFDALRRSGITPLVLTLAATTAMTAGSAISLLLDRATIRFADGWLLAGYGFQIVGWVSFCGALLAAANLVRTHVGRWGFVGVVVGAGGALLIASGTMLYVAFIEQWISRVDYIGLRNWESALPAVGWLALAAGSALIALGIKRARSSAPVRAEPSARWWIREVLSGRS